MVGQGIGRIRTSEELRELYKDVRSSRFKKEETGMGWTCNKNGSRKGRLRKYLTVKRREVEEREELDCDSRRTWRGIYERRRRQKSVDKEEGAFVINLLKPGG